jgi:hypothetical protein
MLTLQLRHWRRRRWLRCRRKRALLGFQLLLNAVKKRVNLGFVVAAVSDASLRESHVADLLWSKSVSRRILQRCLNAVEKRVNLGFVVAAFSNGSLRESPVADLLWSKPTAHR